jgi:hypothetical protein
MKTPISRRELNQGMNWIRPEKRLAIYLRDGMACCYCGLSIEQGIKLTLDHLVAYSKGGSNLVTCCSTCNSARGARAWRAFAAKVAAYVNHGTTAQEIIGHVSRTRLWVIDVPAAKLLMEQRGGFSNSLKNS